MEKVLPRAQIHVTPGDRPDENLEMGKESNSYLIPGRAKELIKERKIERSQELVEWTVFADI